MKTQISISRKLIITLVIFIIGFVLLFNGIYSYYKYNHALLLETMSESECKKGAYVVGNIDSYVVYRVKENNKTLGSDTTLITFFKAYEFYTIPIAQDSYVRIMVSDDSIISRLKNFTDGKGENIYFMGEIIDSPVEFPYNWYASIEDFNPEDVIKPYVIKEIKFENKKDIMHIGFLLMAFSVLLFFSDGGVKSVISKDTDGLDNTEKKDNYYAGHYDKSNQLLIEIRQLEVYEKRLSELKKKCLIAFLTLVIGIYIIVGFSLLEIKIIGILFIIFSLKSIWNYFINSNNTLAAYLVKLCRLESLSVKIEECNYNIEVLQKFLNKKQETQK